MCVSLPSLAPMEARELSIPSCCFSQLKARTRRPERMMGSSRIPSNAWVAVR